MRCIGCDFDLSETRSGRCPECGRDFDPANPATFAGEHNTRFARRLATPPGWPMAIAAALVAVLILRTRFSPGVHFGHSIVALLASLLLGLLYAGRLVAAGIGHFMLPRRRPRVVPIAPKRWLAAPAIVAFALVLNGAGASQRLALWLDRRTLDPIANGVAIEPSAWTPVSVASGRVARGAVWDDIEVAIFDPDTPLGQMSGPFRWEKDGSDPRWIAHARHFEGAEEVPGIVRVRLARLAVFPLEGHGYGGGFALAWAYAPGAPDTFFKGARFTFHRYSGDWFVSRGWIMSLEDEPSDQSPSP